MRAPARARRSTKAPECVLAPGGKIVHHPVTQELDYEVELAVVIGAAGRDIPRAGALGHVFGYTIVNDVTARAHRGLLTRRSTGKPEDATSMMGRTPVAPGDAA